MCPKCALEEPHSCGLTSQTEGLGVNNNSCSTLGLCKWVIMETMMGEGCSGFWGILD